MRLKNLASRGCSLFAKAKKCTSLPIVHERGTMGMMSYEIMAACRKLIHFVIMCFCLSTIALPTLNLLQVCCAIPTHLVEFTMAVSFCYVLFYLLFFIICLCNMVKIVTLLGFPSFECLIALLIPMKMKYMIPLKYAAFFISYKWSQGRHVTDGGVITTPCIGGCLRLCSVSISKNLLYHQFCITRFFDRCFRIDTLIIYYTPAPNHTKWPDFQSTV